MSRRCHHGSPRHAHLGRPPRRSTPAASPSVPAQPPTVQAPPAAAIEAQLSAPAELPQAQPAMIGAAPQGASIAAAPQAASDPAPPAPIAPAPIAPAPITPFTPPPAPSARVTPRAESAPPSIEQVSSGEAVERGATGPQLRRFIKSRAYVPMHELRRRFVINGGDDEVTPVDLADRRRIFVGLPEREGRLLGELLRGGDIGYELSLDPISPIVVGVYPMRPVTRP
jgi:hypothetical protein